MWIDSHQHFWRIRDRAGQWPPPDLVPIHRDFLPPDLEPKLAACGVQGTVLVQTLPTMTDTDFMLELADNHPFILGVVGWVDLKADEAPAQIALLSEQAKLKGLRPMLQDIADDAWIDDPALDPAVAAMQAHGLRFDALVKPQHLKPLTAFARCHPSLPIIVDHGGKPPITLGQFRDWRAAMVDLAASAERSLQTIRFVDRGGREARNCGAPALRRNASGDFRGRPHPVGQRLAGPGACRRLRGVAGNVSGLRTPCRPRRRLRRQRRCILSAGLDPAPAVSTELPQMEGFMNSNVQTALLLRRSDSVAVAIREIPQGATVRAGDGGVTANATIPSGHKIAVRQVEAGGRS